MTANSWNSVGSRASPSMICWNHDATDLACGCTSPQAKCFEVARGFVQDVALNATVCAGPAPTFLGHLTSLPRRTGGGFPHSLTVRPRRSGGFGGVVAGASVMCVTARARGARSLARVMTASTQQLLPSVGRHSHWAKRSRPRPARSYMWRRKLLAVVMCSKHSADGRLFGMLDAIFDRSSAI